MTDRFTCPHCGNEFRLTAEKITPPEPEQQEIKLYCVKDDPGWLTKGKLYDLRAFRSDYTERSGGFHSDFATTKNLFEHFPEWSACLYPLVKRPAKVGEWVYVTEDYTGQHGKPNNIYKVAFDVGDNDVVFRWDGTGCVPQENYLVLDGYTEDETPEYYNGKVVCTSFDQGYWGCSALVVGGVYSIENGRFMWPDGIKGSIIFNSAEDLDRFVHATFIPFLGEQS